jgi:hypothetical protein
VRLIALLGLLACSSATAVPICDKEKRLAYAEAFGGEAPAAWLTSDVWLLDPVHTIYFKATPEGCTVTRTGP